MKKQLSILVSSIVVVAAFLVGLSSILSATGENPSFQEKYEEGFAHVNYHERAEEALSPKTYNKLTASWDKGKQELMADLLKNEKVAKDDWKIIPASDIDIEFTNFLSQDEANSFNQALFSNERKQALQVGDTMPAILLHKEQELAYLYWERKNGGFVSIALTAESNGKSRKWSSGPAVEID